MTMKTISILVRGRVQGVFYRKSAATKAKELGIKGWVKNEPDGSVRIEATATEELLDQLVDWCRDGPRHADVTNVDVEEIKYREFDDFEIQRE